MGGTLHLHSRVKGITIKESEAWKRLTLNGLSLRKLAEIEASAHFIQFSEPNKVKTVQHYGLYLPVDLGISPDSKQITNPEINAETPSALPCHPEMSVTRYRSLL